MQAGQISARAVVKVVVIALLVGAAAVLAALVVLKIRTTLQWVLTAVFLTLALNPAVDMLEHRVRIGGRRLPRVVAIALVYVAAGALFALVVLLVIPPIIREIEGLARNLPRYVHDFEQWAQNNKQFRDLNQKYDLTQALNQQAAKLPAKLGSAAGTLGSATVRLLENLLAAVTILVLAFFLLLDGRRQAERLIDRLPPGPGTRARNVGAGIYDVVKGYVTVNLALATAAGLFTWVVLELLGVDIAVPLALLAVFFDLIPLVGLTAGGILIAIVASFHHFPLVLILWVAIFLVYQQLQDRVIQPLLYRSAVNVHPVIAIVAILVGAELMGVLGALIAIPVAASIGVVIKELSGGAERAEGAAAPPGGGRPQPEAAGK